MAQVDEARGEIEFEIVYFGPALGGKATNLLYIHARTDPSARTAVRSVATDAERTFSFGLRPRTLPPLRGLAVMLRLSTVHGAVYYHPSERVLLERADAIVFVADSQEIRMPANLEWAERLDEHLVSQGRRPESVPRVVQYNKRDLPDVTTIDELERALNPRSVPSLAAVAHQGEGVFDTLRACARLLTA